MSYQQLKKDNTLLDKALCVTMTDMLNQYCNKKLTEKEKEKAYHIFLKEIQNCDLQEIYDELNYLLSEEIARTNEEIHTLMYKEEN